MKLLAIGLTALLTPGILLAQQQSKARVFVTDSDSWQVAGGAGANDSGGGGAVRGGARPQTAEIVKTAGERCKEITVTIKQDNADYVLLLEHEGGKGLGLKDNKWAVFNKGGDAVGSGSTRVLGNSVKDACAALLEDWKQRSGS